ncbi:VirB3 family type IV secretion system protein [Rhizobium sp. NFACC06-2]|uniref:VirB3 family type IV secretion system protein n=1 Tax=Rhizobium sp. NFACC06-2 TaxID=1566264 RepID=UPI0008763F1A|nr:VirB3 family type IV secretion system protein [Rhizobium sp. NFACC06-2]SCY90300.1 type IV secretion system protein VirB3 [Rhizobium sp. NFACC06-2]
MRTPLFIGLTREVTFAGLPVMYLILLMMISMLGFILTGSLTYLIVASGVGYTALRTLAVYDPKLIGAYICAMRQTRMNPGILRGDGMVYRA